MLPPRLSFCTLVVCAAAWGQTAPPARPEFEVASIKPSAPIVERAALGLHIDGAQVRIVSFSLRDYLRIAYRVKDYQVAGPDWLLTEKFDIAAKLAEGADRGKVPEMLASLLEDRFHAKTHRETKEFSVYALVAGKGPLKLKEVALDAPDTTGFNVSAAGGRGGAVVDLGRGASFSMANDRIEAARLTMTQFADVLGRFTDRPVVDSTGLGGTYNLAMEFTPEDFRAMMVRAAIAAGVTLPPEAMRALDAANGDSLFNAVQALGLKLEARKAPLEVVAVDSILRSPTEN
jgi:uncharacterized protein (TIGR03435 family)